jgi:glycosyltransferase involved in cell wall biosynthesis
MVIVHPEAMDSLKDEVSKDIASHSEVNDADVVILHSALSLSVADEIDAPVVIMLHGSLRRASHFRELLLDNTNVTNRYFSNRSVGGVRQKVNDWFSTADVVVSNSDFVKRSTKKYYNTESRVIYPAIDVNKFNNAGDEEDGDYFLSVQRLEWYKRPDVQIEAFKNTDEELYIVGDGTYANAVAGEVKKYDNIHYLGFVDNERLIELYRGAKATIQTSMVEDFGYIPREGLACGTPAITPYEGGYKELYNKGNVGESFDVSNMISGLKSTVIEFDEDTYDEDELRGIAVDNYSFDVIRPQIESAVKDAKLEYENAK